MARSRLEDILWNLHFSDNKKFVKIDKVYNVLKVYKVLEFY